MLPNLAYNKRPHVLAIAGSDSSGGAGIQADLKTIEAWRCYGSSVITGLTAQNTQGVHGIHAVPTDFVVDQLKAVWEDERPEAVKLGMLTSAKTVYAIKDYLEEHSDGGPPIVILDPVMVSTSGHSLIPASRTSGSSNNNAEGAKTEADEDDPILAIAKLARSVHMITPNIPEAIQLAPGKRKLEEVTSLGDMVDLCKDLVDHYGTNILLKGGHVTLMKDELLDSLKQTSSKSRDSKLELVWLDGDENGECVEILDAYISSKGTGLKDLVLADILFAVDSGRMTIFISRYIDTTSTHGTGCTLSSAIACASALELAHTGQGRKVEGSSTDKGGDNAKPNRHNRGSVKQLDNQGICRRAIEYVKSAISSSYPFGKGHGPLNHAVSSLPRIIPPPSKLNPHPFVSYLIKSDLALWKSYVRHPFVVQLGNGTLPRACFEHYIKQDYLYLQHYARAHALGAYKATSFTDISSFTSIASHISRESEMHVSYCSEFGITLAQLKNTPESAPCASYARYILDVGVQGDLLDLYVAVASCLIGYGEVALWLIKEEEAGRAKRDGNLYKKWMEDYSGKEYQDAVMGGIENLETRIAADPPSPAKLEKLTKIWNDCVRLERDFWDMGLRLL